MRISIADDGLKRPLDNSVTAPELQCALSRLCIGRATGLDLIPAELLKYGSELLAQPLADIINHGPTTVDNYHLSKLIFLGLSKTTIQCAILLTIVLLTSIRKAISLVVLRASPQRSNNSCSRTKAGSDPVAALLMQCRPTGG